MASATIFAPVVTNPGGTGSTITPTLPSGHAAGDVIEIWVGVSGVTAWSAPAGWTIKQATSSSGNASTGVRGTILYRRVLAGDTLPLANPTCTLGATVTRAAIAFCKRGSDVEGVHTLPEWLAFTTTAGTANPIRPAATTTLSPENLVVHYYISRSATTAPEPSGYTQIQQVIISGTLVLNVSEKNVADQQTALTNQDASPTSGARWVGMIHCTPSPDYAYFRSASQALTASGTSVTPSLPAGTSSSDNRGNKDLIIATVEAAGASTISPQVGGDWTVISGWIATTSGGGTSVRKYWALYDGSINMQFNRTGTGEIAAYITVYRNPHQTSPIGNINTRQNASSTTSTWDTQNRSVSKATITATCVADGTPSYTSPATWTERMDGNGITCADQTFNAIGGTASASFTLSVANPTLVGLLEIPSVASVITTVVIPATVNLSLTTFAPSIPVANDITVTPSQASLTTSLFASSLKTTTTPTTSSLTLTTFEPSIRITTRVTPTTLALTSTSFAPVLSLTTTPTTQALTLTTFAPTIILATNVIPTTATLSLTTFAPTIATPVTVTPQTAALSVQTFAPKLSETLTPNTVSLTITGLAPSLNSSATPTTQNLVTTTFAPSLQTVVTPTFAELTLITFAPTVNVEAGVIVVPNTATLTLTTFVPVIGQSITATPDPASLVIGLFAPSLNLQIIPTTASLTTATFGPSLRTNLVPSTASLTLATFAPTVTGAGADVTAEPGIISFVLTTYAPHIRRFRSHGQENISRENRTIAVSSEIRSIQISHEERAY